MRSKRRPVAVEPREMPSSTSARSAQKSGRTAFARKKNAMTDHTMEQAHVMTKGPPCLTISSKLSRAMAAVIIKSCVVFRMRSIVGPSTGKRNKGNSTTCEKSEDMRQNGKSGKLASGSEPEMAKKAAAMPAFAATAPQKPKNLAEKCGTQEPFSSLSGPREQSSFLSAASQQRRTEEQTQVVKGPLADPWPRKSSRRRSQRAHQARCPATRQPNR